MKRRRFLQVVPVGLLGTGKIEAKTRTGTFPYDWYVDTFCKQVCDYTGQTLEDVDAVLRHRFLLASDEQDHEYAVFPNDIHPVMRDEFYRNCSHWAKLVLDLDIPAPAWDVVQTLDTALEQRRRLKG